MDYKVILSDLFLSDLQEIVQYLAEMSGSETASRIGNELLNCALEAGQKPFIGQSVKKRPGARKVLRYHYLIYYDVPWNRGQSRVLTHFYNLVFPRCLAGLP